MKTLKEQLLAKSEESKAIIPPEALVVMQKTIDELSATSIIDTAFKTGASLPLITLPNIHGEQISIQDILKDNRIVMVFYRGGWCPYCNLELQALQNLLPEFDAKGVKLVAISPETPENGADTSKEHGLGFEVLSDKGNVVAKKLGLAYKIPTELNEIYLQFGINLEDNQGNTEQELPIAATYIIEKDGTISYHFLEEDYKKRAEPSEILAKL